MKYAFSIILALLVVSSTSKVATHTKTMRQTPLPTCITLYDQCNYKGKAVSICDTNNNLDLASVKSIYIPPKSTLTLYEFANQKGRKAVYVTSQTCINGIQWGVQDDQGSIDVDNGSQNDRQGSITVEIKGANYGLDNNGSLQVLDDSKNKGLGSVSVTKPSTNLGSVQIIKA